MSERITVIARFKVKPEAVAEFQERALDLVRLTRQEDGCLNYDFHRDIQDSTLFFMHENWRDAAALEKHFSELHLREFATATKELLSEPVEIRRLQRIEPNQ